MNRPLLITAGVVIILLMIGIWVYLLAFGTPKQTTEVFTNLGVLSPRETEVRTIETSSGSTAQNSVSLALGGSRLQQLTTRAVAGFAFVDKDNSALRYVERGTGHIYEINLISGTEKQTSLTTLPQTSSAVFSPNATMVAVTSQTDGGSETSVLQANADTTASPSLIAVADNAENIVFKNDQTLYFTIEKDGQTKGYTYNLKTLAQSELFTLPITGLLLQWGENVPGIFAQTKPSAQLEGYLYELQNNTLVPVTNGGHGLISMVGKDYTVVNVVEESMYSSYALKNGAQSDQSLLMIPEKCTFDAQQTMGVWCAAPFGEGESSYPEDWYKGTVVSEDHIWINNLETGAATLVGNLAELSGRTVDVSSLTIDSESSLLLLSNKIDDTLWLYRITQ